MAKGKRKSRINWHLAVAILGVLGTYVAIPEIHQWVFGSTVAADSPFIFSNEVVEVTVSGSNNDVEIKSGEVSSKQDSYTIRGSNSETTITLRPHAGVKLQIFGSNNSIHVSDKIVIASTVNTGGNNKVVQ